MSLQRSPAATRQLIKAAMIEGVCILGGVAGFIATGNWIWLAGGVLLGQGVSQAALVTYLRSKG